MRSDHIKRHHKTCSKAPESISSRHTICPICKKIMLIANIKRHMTAKHNASSDVNVR
jgi:hypothetical protein